MLLLKIGGSLIAPKDKNNLDYDYLKKISFFLQQFDNIFLIHGTGNVGHTWVNSIKKENYDIKILIRNNYLQGRKLLDKFFYELDEYFGFKRIDIDTFLNTDKKNFSKGKYIIGGDILKNGEIISSDEIYSILLKEKFINRGFMLTDVDGVLDLKSNLITKIDKNNINSIIFWGKKNDVTGSMKSKVISILNTGKKTVICNGKDIENLDFLLNKNKGRGTVII